MTYYLFEISKAYLNCKVKDCTIIHLKLKKKSYTIAASIISEEKPKMKIYLQRKDEGKYTKGALKIKRLNINCQYDK